jgi:nicotinamidase-related amidase
MKEEGIDMKVLVVVDMQNDFIDGALGTKEAEAGLNDNFG